MYIVTIKGATCMYRRIRGTLSIMQINPDNVKKFGFKTKGGAQKAADDLNRVGTPYIVTHINELGQGADEGRCPKCKGDRYFCMCEL